MGKVFKAIQCRSGRPVALKVVRAHLMANKTVVGRYRREAAAAARLNHPNIVTLLDADEAQGRYFLAMEFVYGSDLSRMVKEFGPLPYAEAAEYIRQGALGLQHAHESGLIHRDIKPSNMLVSGERALPDTGGVAAVRILDMGLVRSLADDDDANKTELTRDGTVVGTPDYMAPEQAKNSSTVDHRADIYSLGCTLYYLLVGKPPFPEGTPIDKLLRHQLDPPPDIRKLRPDVPDEMVRAMVKMLAKKPEDRIPTAGEVSKILAKFTAEGLANVPEIVLTMPDHVPAGSAPIVPAGDTATSPAVRVFEAEVVTRKPNPTGRPVPVPTKKAVRLVPREADSNDAISGLSPATRRRDSSEDMKAMPGSNDDTRPRGRDTEAALARQKRHAKARLANRKRKKATNWLPLVLGAAGAIVLAFAGWMIFKPKGDGKPPAVEIKNPEPPPPVARAGLPPVWANVPDGTAAVIVVHPDALWPAAKDRIAAGSRFVKSMNHLTARYHYDLRAGERFTVALAPGRTPGYAATVDGAFLTAEWAGESEKWGGVKVEKLGSSKRLQFGTGSDGSNIHGLLGGSRRGYTLTNEESLLLDLARRGANGKPNVADAIMAALPDSNDPNRPTFTFAATGAWSLPDGLTLADLGADHVVIHARLVEDRFEVDVEVLGTSKDRVRDFVNLRLWDAVNSKHPGIKPVLRAITENTANDGWDTVGKMHRLKKTESGVWAIPDLIGWVERLLPD